MGAESVDVVFKVMGFDAIKEEESVDRDGQRRQAEMRERRREEMGRGKGGEGCWGPE